MKISVDRIPLMERKNREVEILILYSWPHVVPADYDDVGVATCDFCTPIL